MIKMKAVCIGGPLDGEYHEIEEGKSHFSVMVHKNPSGFARYDCDLELPLCVTHTYFLRCQIFFGNAVYYYEHDSNSKDGAFIRNIVSKFQEGSNQKAKYHHIIEELENIIINEPMSDGDSISSSTLHACFAMGYATRENDMVVSTGTGKYVVEQLKRAYLDVYGKRI
jgi:hypothetical protein